MRMLINANFMAMAYLMVHKQERLDEKDKLSLAVYYQRVFNEYWKRRNISETGLMGRGSYRHRQEAPRLPQPVALERHTSLRPSRRQ